MKLIASALATENATVSTEVAPVTAAATVAEKGVAAPVSIPGSGDVLIWNIGFVAVMVVLFYFLLIRPQQARYKAHTDMMKGLKKGDKIILQSGMVAIIDKIEDGSDEVLVDLHAGTKVIVLRGAIAGRYEEIVKK